MVGMDATLEVCIVPLSALHQLLNELRGTGLTVEQHQLVTEIVALCLLATHPAPLSPLEPKSDAERAKRYRDRVKAEKSVGVVDATAEVRPASVTERDASRDAVTIRDGGPMECNKSYSNKSLGFMPSKELKTISPIDTISISPRVGKRLPELWAPTQELLDWALDQLGLERTKIEFETGAFRDFWHAKAGQGGVKLRWDLTWKNWMREVKRRDDNRLTRKVKEQKPYYFGPV